MKRLVLGAAVLAFAACSDSDPADENMDMNDDGDGPVDPVDPTDPDDPPDPIELERDYDELASVLAAHVRAEFALHMLSVDITENRLPANFSLTSSAVEGSAGVGTVGSLNLAFEFHCNDGSATHTFVPCDGNAHHSHIKYTMDGAVAIDNMSMSGIQRVVDWEIRDITVDKARFRGPDQLVLNTQVTTEGVAADYKIQFHANYEQVRYLPGDLFPTFGTIDFMVNTERQRDADRRVFDATAQLVYGVEGSPSTLTIDGTHVYSVDFATGAVAKVQ